MVEGDIVIAVYLRVSSDRQEVEGQRHGIARWVAERRYPQAEIIEYVDDGISGKTTDRPSFQRMMADVRAGRVHRVITFEISRLSRDFLTLLEVMKTFQDHGVVVEVPGEGEQPFQSTMQQFLLAAKSLVAAQEREHISTRTKNGMAAAKARGVKLGPPKGTKNRLGKTKTHDRDLIARLQRLAKKLSCREIAEEVGLSHSTVARLLKQYAVKPPNS